MSDYVPANCPKCKTQYWLPRALHAAGKASENITFYCPYGHPAHYPAGDSAEDVLRRERDKLRQQLAQKDDAIKWQRDQRIAVERRLSATQGVVTRIKNRVGHGICPCCNRTFNNLTRHMHSQHPAYAKDEQPSVTVQ